MFVPKFLVSLSLVIASILGILFWAVPLWNDPQTGLSAIRAERERVLGLRDEKQRELEAINETKQEFLDLRETICEAGVASNCSPGNISLAEFREPDFLILPPREDIPEYLAELTAIANDTGLVMTNVSFRPSKDESGGAGEAGRGRVDTSIAFSGTYPNFKKFLAGIEQSQRLIDVSDISFSKGEGDSFGFSMNLTAYFQP